jgi:hypothetical protein
MTYNKPNMLVLAQAVEAVQSLTDNEVGDSISEFKSGAAYEVDE